MGLVNARNLRKAKQLLEKNRGKVGDMVEKAGGQLDKASKGKTSSFTSKAADAARNYSEGGVTHHGVDAPVSGDGQYGQQSYQQTSSDAKVREAQATAGAANAVKGAADALTNMMNKAAATAEAQNAGKSSASAGSAPKPKDDDPFDPA